MTMGQNWSGVRRAIVGRPDENFDVEKVPQELQDHVWLSAFRPRTIIIQGVVILVDRDQASFDMEEVTKPYDQPVTLSVSPDSRNQTLRHYTRILAHSIPGDGIHLIVYDNNVGLDYLRDAYVYFNYELDTLTYHPQVLECILYRQEDPGSFAREDRVESHPANSYDISQVLGLLKKHLHLEGNNLEPVQSIALSGVHWPTTIPGAIMREEVYIKEISTGIQEGFQNLTELILVRDDEEDVGVICDDCRKAHYLDMRTQQSQDYVRKHIITMFQEEQRVRPACKIPKIIFVAPTNPRAPQYETIPFGMVHR